jgi:hypothetical protein
MVNDVCRNSVNISKPITDVNNTRQRKKNQAEPTVKMQVTLNPYVATDRQTALTSHLCWQLIPFKPAKKVQVKMAFAQNKTLCIGQFVKINSVTSVQRQFHAQRSKHPVQQTSMTCATELQLSSQLTAARFQYEYTTLKYGSQCHQMRRFNIPVAGTHKSCALGHQAYYTLTPNICGSSIQNLLHVALLAPKIFRHLIDFWNICVPLPYRHTTHNNR